MADLSGTFVREIDVFNTTLSVHQAMVGDVGCVVWDAAIVLIKYLEKSKKLENKVILELGAGTGAVSLCCAIADCSVVISTDLQELLPLLELNKKVNFEKLKGKFTISKLKWGEESDLKGLPQLDFLIMSDVIYYTESIEPLVKTICELAGANTEILMSYEDRFDGDKPFLQKTFFELIDKHFMWYEIPKEEQDHQFQSSDIHIISMKKKT